MKAYGKYIDDNNRCYQLDITIPKFFSIMVCGMFNPILQKYTLWTAKVHVINFGQVQYVYEYSDYTAIAMASGIVLLTKEHLEVSSIINQ